MGRSSKKGPYIDPKLMKKVMMQKQQGGTNSPIKTWTRACQIPPEFVGHTFAVHNGRIFMNVFVTEGYGGSQAWRICSNTNI
jgi:small subunit ribosomal protein S19